MGHSIRLALGHLHRLIGVIDDVVELGLAVFLLRCDELPIAVTDRGFPVRFPVELAGGRFGTAAGQERPEVNPFPLPPRVGPRTGQRGQGREPVERLAESVMTRGLSLPGQHANAGTRIPPS